MRICFLLAAVILVLFVGCVNPPSPVCNKPYILVGTDCCLDRDDNLICDRDEASTTRAVTTTTEKTSTTSTSSTTTTTTKAASTTTSTTTSTSSTTTTLKKLPVSMSAYEEHIKSSPEYARGISLFGEKRMVVYMGSDKYADVKEDVQSYDKNHDMDCFECFNWSRGMLWISEFGNKDYEGYSCILDMETGTGAMYTFNAKKTTCRCDTIWM